MNFHELQTLVDYHYWARDRVLDAIEPLTPEQFTRDLANSFPSIKDTIVHLYGADWVWCARWDGESPDGMPSSSAFSDLASLRLAWGELERRIRGIVQRLGPAGTAQMIAYRRNGVSQAQPFWQLVQHVVNHGSYHRGQITTMLRQVGAAPPKAVDLVAFYREQAGTTV